MIKAKGKYLAYDTSAIWWAVYLGCDTPGRLAREWGLTFKAAGERLANGVEQGRLRRLGRGKYAVAE